MTDHEARGTGNVAAGAALLPALALAWVLWWPSRSIYALDSDTLSMMAVSSEVARGEWSRLLQVHEVHVQPLFRLFRLYFDLHFPEQFAWSSVVMLVAHSASTLLLYGLSRRFLATAAGALAAAVLFAWHTLGADAMIISAQSTYVLSLPLVLGALWAVHRLGEGGRGVWGILCLVCLTASVGLHSLAAVAQAPAVLLAYYVLRSPAGRTPKARWLAWTACTFPALLGAGLWMANSWNRPSVQEHFGHFPSTPGQVLARLADAVYGSALHLAFLAVRVPPSPPILLAVTLGFLTLLFRLRRRPASRWALAALLVAAFPALLIFILRTSAGYQGSRYLYHGFMPVAVAAGCLVDEVLRTRGPKVERASVLAVVILLLSVFYPAQAKSLRMKTALLGGKPPAHRAYWIAWKDFFQQVSQRASASGAPWRLPPVRVDPEWTTTLIFQFCYLRGNPAIQALAPAAVHPADCSALWEAMQRAREPGGPLHPVALPGSLAIVGPHAPLPNDSQLACVVNSVF